MGTDNSQHACEHMCTCMCMYTHKTGNNLLYTFFSSNINYRYLLYGHIQANTGRSTDS